MDWLTPIKIRVDGHEFTGGVGDWWIVADSFEGWYDSPESRYDNDLRPSFDGTFDSDLVLVDAREVTWMGRHQAESEQAAAEAMSWASGLVKRTDLRVEVEDSLGIRWVRAKTKGRIRARHLAPTRVEFLFTFEAADPRKYGATQVDGPMGLPSGAGGILSPVTSPLAQGVPGNSGRTMSTNSGNADTWSTHFVTGGLQFGFELYCTELGQTIRMERPIPEGSTVAVDHRRGIVMLDGINDITTFLTIKEWWSVPAGETRTVQFNALGATTGAPTLTAETPSAYL